MFVLAIASVGDGSYPIGDIADALGKSLSAIGPARANTIKRGMIYSTEHGYLDFTLPLYAEHLRRVNPDA